MLVYCIGLGARAKEQHYWKRSDPSAPEHKTRKLFGYPFYKSASDYGATDSSLYFIKDFPHKSAKTVYRFTGSLYFVGYFAQKRKRIKGH